MPDITVNELIANAELLPGNCVAAEVALKNCLIPIVAAVAATKNGTLCIKADTLSLDIFNFELKVNAWAQNFADTVTQYKPLAVFFGNAPIPGSGVVIDALKGVVDSAEKFQSSVEAHNVHSIATAKEYILAFIGAAETAIGFRPQLGVYSAAGVSVSQVLAGLTEVVHSI